jgi:hypothetical protein
VASTESSTPGVRYAAEWARGLDGWAPTHGWLARGRVLYNDGSDFGDGNWLDGLWNRHVAVAPFEVPADLVDYAIEAEIRVMRRPVCGSFGLLVRGSYQVGVHDCEPGAAPVLSVRSAEPELIANEPFPSTFDPAEDWRLYRVEVQGSRLRVLVDGALIAQVDDASAGTSGPIGLWDDHTELQVGSFRLRDLTP